VWHNHRTHRDDVDGRATIEAPIEGGAVAIELDVDGH
jgi:hypothetical protein